MTERYGTYSLDSLTGELALFESRYGISSETHRLLRYEGGGGDMQAAYGIPNFESAVWASTYSEWRRLLERTEPESP